MLDWLKTNAGAAKKRLQDEVSKFKNREFMEAVVAGCALVASADGNISSEEKQKMIAFMQNSDELKVFMIDDVISFFNEVVSKFDFDHQLGKIEALKVTGKLRSKPDAARTMVRVCCVIGSSDGNFDEKEHQIVREICTDVGLLPADFGL
ncbi:tellurite resistance TerB family protein [Mesorhizobium sp. M0808]|uniref:tellurite resistance TerB family protein n=1 Tax=unclassified Mesorhizobium TaxID=325217 RepID=UPI0033390196